MAIACQTLKPWDEVHSEFTNAAGLKVWLERIYGDPVTYDDLKEIRAWIETANPGDTVHIGDDFKLVARELADIEIRYKPT